MKLFLQLISLSSKKVNNNQNDINFKIIFIENII